MTILVPTRNRARWLRGSLTAALAQSFEDFELFVSDNASTDETPDVMAREDRRLIADHRMLRPLAAATLGRRVTDRLLGRWNGTARAAS